MRIILVCLLTLFLLACRSTPNVVIPEEVGIYDTAFPDYTIYTIESAEEVFALDEEARNFVRDLVNREDRKNVRLKKLIKTIFDRKEMDLLYANDANTSASETFHNRSANCLSLSIMTYALATAAGYDVRFQDVQIPEYWTRRDGFSMLNGHINLSVKARMEPNSIQLINPSTVVDFDPQNMRKHFPIRTVKINTVMSMYYNNKGADALINNAYTKAYAYFRAAAKADPMFDSTWVNLGVLYRMTDNMEQARATYKKAIDIAPENYTAWENLAILHLHEGEKEEHERLSKWVESKRQSNPFYHFILGEKAFEEQEFTSAISYFKKAIRLDSNQHEAYFGLAKVYAEMGDASRSESFLRKAKRNALFSQDKERYQGKLNLLTSL